MLSCEYTKIINAARRGSIVEISKLLKQGYDINCGLKENIRTPLHWAVQEKRCRTVKYLINNGAVIDAIDEDGMTPLVLASGNGCLLIVKLLLENGANPNIQIRKSGMITPLHNACAWGCNDCVKVLIKYGANINLKDIDGHKPKYYAKKAKKYEIIGLLDEIIQHSNK